MPRSVRTSIPFPQIIPHERTPLCEDLEDMPISLFHHIEDLVHKGPRDILVEQITHGIYEHLTRPPPTKRLFQTLFAQRQIESHLKGMANNSAKPFRKSLSVAIVASPGNLGTPSDGIPSRVGPFDPRLISHSSSQNKVQQNKVVLSPRGRPTTSFNQRNRFPTS